MPVFSQSVWYYSTIQALLYVETSVVLVQDNAATKSVVPKSSIVRGGAVAVVLPTPSNIRRWEIWLWCALLLLMVTPVTYIAIRCAQPSSAMLEGSDDQFYYAILRSAVFDYDADLRNELRLLTPSAKTPTWQASLAEITDPASGQIRCKYTVGWSVVAAPGYLLVRAWDFIAGVPANGYELRYQAGASYSILLAGWLGLLLSYALARRLSGPWTAAAATLLVLFGSGLFFSAAMQQFVAHGAGFFAVSAFVYLACSIAWGRFDGRVYWLLLGFLAGLMSIVRATNLVYCLFGLYPLLARLRSSQGGGKKLLLDVALALAGMLPPVAAQVLFWLGNVGKLAVYSYGAEPFFWGEPRLLSYLFSQRHGLFFYAPVLLLSLAGLLLALGPRSPYPARIGALVGLLCVMLLVYVNSCWWAWWFGSGFGTRSLIEASPVWIVGLGLLLANMKGKARIGAMVVAIVFCMSTLTLFGLYVIHRWPMYTMNTDPALKGLRYPALNGHPPGTPDYFHRVHNID